MTAAVWAAGLVAWAVAGLRWLRVAQREHYLTRSATRFALRWWTVDLPNRALGLAALLSLVLTFRYPAAGLVAAGIVAVAPLGLGVRGRTAPLRWTPRLGRLTAAVGILSAALLVGGAAAGFSPETAVAAAVLSPVLVDLALGVLDPVERRLSAVFVDRAGRALIRVGPTIVAITGSFGKTSTKNYLAHLLGGHRSVVASPASFNNRLGLARAINEHLAPGTEVFIAEMGTYGRGEIADLCAWITPDVGVITAIGPVHLERFGSLDAIAEAKAEILEGARAAVLNIDDPRLARIAGAVGGRVIGCSVIDRGAEVFVDEAGDLGVHVGGRKVGTLGDPHAMAGNVACAVGVLVALEVPLEGLTSALANLPGPDHRRSVLVGEAGFTIIDDTYNANPAGARAALKALRRLAGPGRRVVVTPGMVELGRTQRAENAAFASEAGRVATDLIIVGKTNRRALLEGTRETEASVMVMDSREQAVDWVRRTLAGGDVVLYENDLPDHYP